MPERTCLGCRTALAKGNLVRYVMGPDGQLLVDYRARLPGRGAYTCVSPDCLTQAVKRQQFKRAFRAQGLMVDVEDLRQQLLEAIRDHIVSLIGMARKSGQIIVGTREVEVSLGKKPAPALLIIGNDVSTGTGESLLRAAVRHQVRTATLLSRDALGQLLGKSLTSAVAFPAGSLAAHVVQELDRYQTVLGES